MAETQMATMRPGLIASWIFEKVWNLVEGPAHLNSAHWSYL